MVSAPDHSPGLYMRASLLSLLIPAGLGGGLGLMLISCHKEKPPAPVHAAAAPGRTIKLQAYDAEIPKAPLSGEKLDTIAQHSPSVSTPPAPAVQPPPPPVRVARPEPAPARSPRAANVRPYAYADSGYRPYVPARQAGAYAPDDPRGDAEPEAAGFRLTVPICRRAERQDDPLADTAECRDILQAARATAQRCAQAYEEGDDRVVLSPACRQAAMTREGRN
jgi:hypothetical protein